MYENKESTKNLVLYALDIVGVFICYFLSNALWLWAIKGISLLTRRDLFENLGIMLSSFIVVLFLFNSNKDFLKRRKFDEFLYSIKINLGFAAAYAVLMLIKGGDSSSGQVASRGVFVLTPLFNVFVMFLFHELFKLYLVGTYSRKKKSTQMFLITTKDRAESAMATIESNVEWVNKLNAIAIVDEDMVGKKIGKVPVRANYDTMVKFVKDEAIDEIFIDLPYFTGTSLRPYIMDFENMGAVVHLNIEILENFKDFNKSLSMFGDTPVITFATNSYDVSKLIIKRIIDIIGAIVGLIITFVIGLFLAPVLLIESPGPLIFKQKRVGKNGRYFYLYKFRSMYKDAEERKKALMEQNEMKGLMFKMKDDPRITKVGKFIRKTSIDELPQFWNVLMGDMSLVGTRPPTVDEFKQYEGYHKRRLSMKPGITGMWQVSGRSDIEDFEEVVKLDLKYIDNWNLWLDIKILFRTVGAVFKHSGAK